MRRSENESGNVARRAQPYAGPNRPSPVRTGKALLRKRGEFIERSFCHVLDQGGMRRATLRGCLNLTKRLIGTALAFDLSLLMRHLHGVGTPKQ
jgi:hypothetical protein